MVFTSHPIRIPPVDNLKSNIIMRRIICIVLCLAGVLLNGCTKQGSLRLTSEAANLPVFTNFGRTFCYEGLSDDLRFVLTAEYWKDGVLCSETPIWEGRDSEAQFTAGGSIQSGHLAWSVDGAYLEESSFETTSGGCYWSVQILDKPGVVPEDGMVLACIMHMDGNTIRPFACVDLTEEIIAQYDDAALLRLHIEPA